MKVNVDNLTIVPVHPLYTQEYRKAISTSLKHINTFLAFDDFVSTTFQETSSYLLKLRKMNNIYPAFFVVDGKKVLAHFQWTEALDERGVQFIYWVRNGFGGNGIATAVTDLLVQRAFLGYVYQYVEIHTDVANLASRRIPEKLGFQIEDTYQGKKFGSLGTGEMEIWIKWNEYLGDEIRTELPTDKTFNPFRWGVSARAEKQLMSRVITAGLNKYSRVKQRLVFA
jgi:ribosomal-protein-serine acetyltransferase